MESENMRIYEASKSVPQEAKKNIVAGRLRGFTDINPMWRIKKLTELFGACGIGWYTEPTKKWIEEGADGVKIACCDINLYIKDNNEWSKPIPGTGGALFVSKEKDKLYTSDEAFKMASTDAISVACKMLGIGADVYWDKDSSKYDTLPVDQDAPKKDAPKIYATPKQLEIIRGYKEETQKGILKSYNITVLEELKLQDATDIIKRKNDADKKRKGTA